MINRDFDGRIIGKVCDCCRKSISKERGNLFHPDNNTREEYCFHCWVEICPEEFKEMISEEEIKYLYPEDSQINNDN